MSPDERRTGATALVPPGASGESFRMPHSILVATRALRRGYPFTLAGSVLLVAAAFLVFVGFTRYNVYALLLGLLAAAVLALLAVLGRVQAIRFGRVQVRWDTSQTLVARRRGTGDRLIVERVRSFLFFRLHARIRGRLEVGRGATLSIARESATTAGEGRVEMDLPLAGTLRATASTAVRDVFGLTVSRFGDPHDTVRPVLPVSVRDLDHLPISASGGNEEQNRRAQVEEEKYFMREYQPGDKARDINWKASSRLAQLITRISPYTQEKSKVIRIEIRPYRKPRPESLDSVIHLNRLKARVVSFLRAVKTEHPEYTFDVRADEARWMIEAVDQIESFARDLAGLWYRPDPGRSETTPVGQLVVFTTPFDDALPLSLAAYGRTVLHVITTTAPDPRKSGDAERQALFPAVLQGGRIDLPLPGRWALRRERVRSRLGKALPNGAGVAGSVTEEPITVTLFEEP